ncbi:MAG: amidase [Bacteroidetes bacterium SW_9_63_38]|nr:MAG: amidase [Bacteroidetes bacterium SW_9_63_38]
MKAHLQRIERWNRAVNAVVTLDADAALAQARTADEALAEERLWGPLHGVPFTVKDQFATEDLRTTYGLPQYTDFVPNADAVTVARLRRAGGILLGKTNLPLASYDWQSDHPEFGRTANPWALSRTSGGSSGGSAAALAAGFSPLELGADVAGSIRVPSHFCGVVGLRPTEDTLPLDGLLPPDEERTVHNVVVPGPMARSVEDLQLAWQVLTNTDTPTTPAPETLRIAVTPELGGVPVDTETQQVLRKTVDRLKHAGCTVEHRSAPIDIDEALTTWADIQGYELGASLPAPFRVPPLKTLAWHGWARYKFGFLGRRLAQGAHLSPRGYLSALDRRARLARLLDAFLTDWDLWLTPTASIPAFPHQATGHDLAIEGEPVPYALPFAVYNCATAVTGHPILTLPAGHAENGLPIGLQVHARRHRDASLLAAGRCLELLTDPSPQIAPLSP